MKLEAYFLLYCSYGSYLNININKKTNIHIIYKYVSCANMVYMLSTYIFLVTF